MLTEVCLMCLVCLVSLLCVCVSLEVRLLEVEQACSSLACYFLSSVVMLWVPLFVSFGTFLGVLLLGGATGRMWP